jgi:6-phosphogluconolactonase (cycloisomerase 2 family)
VIPRHSPQQDIEVTVDAYHIYVGCRTTRERNARGNGINLYRMETASGRWTHVQLVDGLTNPSFLALDRTGRFLYAVHGDAEEISAFRVEAGSGRLTFLNGVSTGGRNPVHLAVDPANRFIVVPNHLTSTLAVLPIDPETGHLGERTDLVTLSGPIGPHRVEQPFAKPHQTEFDRAGSFILVPDKGLDRVFVFRLDPVTGRLSSSEQGSAMARETSGPRHVALHPGGYFAYVLNELDSSITAYRYDTDTGALEPFQLLPSLPDNFTGNSRAAEITVSADGRFIYASNRGHDSIGTFSIEKGTGRLTPVEWTATSRTPRFITLDPSGRFLFAASEDEDTITAFSVSAETGRLSRLGEAARTGSPVCIIFRPAEPI